jgi:hypothetical protein
VVTLVLARGLLGQSPLDNGAGPRVTSLHRSTYPPLPTMVKGLGFAMNALKIAVMKSLLRVMLLDLEVPVLP